MLQCICTLAYKALMRFIFETLAAHRPVARQVESLVPEEGRRSYWSRDHAPARWAFLLYWQTCHVCFAQVASRRLSKKSRLHDRVAHTWGCVSKVVPSHHPRFSPRDWIGWVSLFLDVIQDSPDLFILKRWQKCDIRPFSF